jgi:hypothetical protein
VGLVNIGKLVPRLSHLNIHDLIRSLLGTSIVTLNQAFVTNMVMSSVVMVRDASPTPVSLYDGKHLPEEGMS